MKWLTLSIVTLLSVSSFTSPGKVLLRLNPQAGQNITWSIESKLTMNMVAPGMPEPMNMGMGNAFSMQVNVLDINSQSKTYTLGNSLDSMSMSMSGVPGMDMSFNSNRTASGDANYEAMAETLRPLLDARIASIISEMGEIQEIKGIKELNEKMGASGGASGMSSNPFENLQTYFPIYPEKKIAVGSTWDAETTMSNNGSPVNVKYTYTLREISNGMATLDVVSAISMPESKFDQGGMEMTISMAGTQQGEMTINTKDGITRSASLKQNITMDMSTMGMSMPATLTGTVSLTTISQ
jgi:hypothetical protein